MTTKLGEKAVVSPAIGNEVVGVVSGAPKRFEVAELLKLAKPMLADNSADVCHVFFGPSGLIDTVSGNQAKWTSANAPPLVKKALPGYAGHAAGTRNVVGKPFTTSNYITCGTTLLNFPTAPWTVALEVDHVDSATNDVIIGCTSGAAGWMVMTNPGSGPYVLCNNDGPRSTDLGSLLYAGRNTIICGWDGTNLLIKINGGQVVTKAVSYTVPTGATGYIGRYSAGLPYAGGIYEAWGSTDTPTAASMDALYRASRLEHGNDYRFPRTATTRFSFHAKDFASNTWSYKPWVRASTTDPTLTTVGTVPVATEAIETLAGDGRWVISPGGQAAVLTAETVMYYLSYANNFLDFETSFHGAMVVIPDAGSLLTTQVYLASGWSTTVGGWQLVNEDNVDTPSSTLETVFIGSTGQINGPIPVAGKLNIICFGFDSANGLGYIKVNNSGTQVKATTVTKITASGSRRDQAQIGGHNNMDIGCVPDIVELVVRTGVPTHDKFQAIIREILARQN